MAKVQIITAMTLDGFLPGEDEELVKWVKTDKRGFELLHSLSIYHLIDEIVVYILPLTYGRGSAVLQQLPVTRWQLHESVMSRNGICRLVYRKSSR